MKEDEQAWVRHACAAAKGESGHLPGALWGHSLTAAGSNAFLFGGVQERRGADKACADDAGSASMFVLRMSASAMVWERLRIGYPLPRGRWRHTATTLGTDLIVFGGSHTLDERLNDVWVFDCVCRQWRQPPGLGARDPHLPPPLAGHSAAMHGTDLVVFGGYGGEGKGRRHFNDLRALDTATWLWRRLAVTGPSPAARSSHQAHVVASRLFIFGGSDAAVSMSDAAFVDLAQPTLQWTLVDCMPAPCWCAASVLVESVPSAKVFFFGGMRGPLREGGSGDVSARLLLFDTELLRWSEPMVSAPTPPARADCVLVANTKSSRLVLHGGWGGASLSDLHSLDVSRLVGPPYLLTGVQPPIGPVTGGTQLSLEGLDFVNTPDIVVRFSAGARHIDVAGVFASQSLITCVSPDLHPLGRVARADIRIALAGDSFTSSFAVFEIFTITHAPFTLMFGPGLLSGCAIKEETCFVILARDNLNHNRTSGGDQFGVSVCPVREGEADRAARVPGVSVKDRGDGTYLVRYAVRAAGRYRVEVEFLGTFGGTPGPVSGSGAEVDFDELASRNNNVMAGALMIRALKEDVLALRDRATDLAARIFVRLGDPLAPPEERIQLLMGVRESIEELEPLRPEMTRLIDRSLAVLAYLRERGTVLEGVDAVLAQGAALWSRCLNESAAVLDQLLPLMAACVGTVRADMFAFLNHVDGLRGDLADWEFTDFEAGHKRAVASLEAAELLLADQLLARGRLGAIARAFDCLKDMAGVTAALAELEAFLRDYRLFWACALKHEALGAELSAALWSGGVARFDEQVDGLAVFLKRLPRRIKAASVYASLERRVAEFGATCGILRSLHSPALRERHWLELSRAVGQSVPVPEQSPALTLGQVIALGLVAHAAAVARIVTRAEVEARHEELLDRVQEFWAGAALTAEAFADTGVSLLGLAPADGEQLQDDLAALRQVLRSEAAHFHRRARDWEQSLELVADAMAQLQRVQTAWRAQQPLFEAEEVRQELRDTAQLFREADSSLRFLLSRLHKGRLALRVAKEGGLRSKLVALAESLDQFQGEIWALVARRRASFPRLHFLSDALLLELIAGAAHPSRVLKHIREIQPATLLVLLDRDHAIGEDRPSALGFADALETVALDRPVDLSGSAQDYLQRLLLAQRGALRSCFVRQMHRSLQLSRELWALEKDAQGAPLCPGQLLLLVADVRFCHKVEHALFVQGEGEAGAVRAYLATCVAQLQQLARTALMRLSALDRVKVGNLLLGDAHRVDVLERMVAAEAAQADFLWQSQLRSRVVEEQEDRVVCSLLGCEMRYDFEYQGCRVRAAVSPVVERVYASAALAMAGHRGVAVLGGPDAGKLESLRSFAASLGRFHRVFDCRGSLDLAFFERCALGVASSGCMGVFANVGALPAHVLAWLSALLVRARARGEGGKGEGGNGEGVFLATFTCVGANFRALPKELRGALRPVALMRPDAEAVCRHLLLASGCAAAADLAGRVAGLYACLADSLVHTPAALWGLSAMRALLAAFSPLRQADEHAALDDEALLRLLLRDLSESRVHAEDAEAFSEALDAYFPHEGPPRRGDEALLDLVCAACDELGLWAHKGFGAAALRLDEMLDVWRAVAVVGPPASGKSAVRNVLALARQRTAAPLHERVLFPSVGAQALLEALGECGEGTLLVLDGPLADGWLERLTPFLGDDGAGTDSALRTRRLPSSARVLLEAVTLQDASPGALGRLGVLALPDCCEGQRASILGCWIRRRPRDLFDLRARETLHRLIERYAPPSFKTALSMGAGGNEAVLACRLCSFLDALLTARATVLDPSLLERAVALGALWACGSGWANTDSSRAKFSDWFRRAFPALKVPAAGTAFDYWLPPAPSQPGAPFESWTAHPDLAAAALPFGARLDCAFLPSAETAQLSFFAAGLLSAGASVAVAGALGSGRSVLCRRLLRAFGGARFVRGCGLTAERLSDVLLGPSTEPSVCFIDDLAVADRPVAETVRFALDQGCAMDFRAGTSKPLETRASFLCVVEGEDGGDAEAQRVLARFVRFSFALPLASTGALLLSVVQTHLAGAGFPAECVSAARPMVRASLALYEQVELCFRQSPARPHYRFSTGTLFRAFFGFGQATTAMCPEPGRLVEFWLHELNRTFLDALVDADADRYRTLARDVVRKEFPHLHLDKCLARPSEADAEPLLYAHFSDSASFADPSSLSLDRVEDLAASASILRELVGGAGAALLFDEAVRTIAKLARLVSLRSHALVIAEVKAGKRLLASLAASLMGCVVMGLSLGADYGMSNLRADWMEVSTRAGLRGCRVALVVPEHELLDDEVFGHLYDLAAGVAPELYSRDFRQSVLAQLSEGKAQADPALLWRGFAAAVADNVVLLLLAAPSSASLRRRLVAFPSLSVRLAVCCVALWREAHSQCCRLALASHHSLRPHADALQDLLPRAFALAQEHTHLCARDFLDLVQYFVFLASRAIEQTQRQRGRLESALARLEEVQRDLVLMQDGAAEIADRARASQELVAELEAGVRLERSVLEEERGLLAEAQRAVDSLDLRIGVRAGEAALMLAAAAPHLETAEGALELVSRRDLGELATALKPPEGAEEVLAALTVLLAGTHPHVAVQKSGRVRLRDLAWEGLRRGVLGNVNLLLDEMGRFRAHVDEGSVPRTGLREVRAYLAMPHFRPEVMERRCEVAGSLCAWVIGMVQYADVVESIEPLRIEIEVLKTQLEQRVEERALAETHIAARLARMQTLVESLEAAAEADRAARRLADDCELKVASSQRLLDALAPERSLWAGRAEAVRDDARRVVGDCFLRASVVCLSAGMGYDARDAFLASLVAAAADTLELSPGLTAEELCGGADERCDAAAELSHARPFRGSALLAGRAPRGACLVLDPEGVSRAWLALRHPGPLLREDQPQLEATLVAAAAAGRTAVVLLRGDEPSERLRCYLRSRGAHPTWDARCSLFLLCARAPALPPQTQSEVRVVSFAADATAAAHLLCNGLLETYFGSVYAFRSVLEVSASRCTQRRMALEEGVLEALAGEAGRLLSSDRRGIDGILACKLELADTSSAMERIGASLEAAHAFAGTLDEAAQRGAAMLAVALRLGAATGVPFSLAGVRRFVCEGARRHMQGNGSDAQCSGALSLLTLPELALEERRLEAAATPSLLASHERDGDRELRRRAALIDSVTRSVYRYLVWSLDESDRLAAATLIAFSVSLTPASKVRLFCVALQGGAGSDGPTVERPSWATEDAWRRVVALEENARAFSASFVNLAWKVAAEERWAPWFASAAPEESVALPAPFDDAGAFERLLLFKALRPDRFLAVLREFLEAALGAGFLSLDSLSPEAAFGLATASHPVIYLQSQDANQWATLGYLQAHCDVALEVDPRPSAAPLELVAEARQSGRSLFLGNAHLAGDALLQLAELLREDASAGFRLFLSVPRAACCSLPPQLTSLALFVSDRRSASAVEHMEHAWAALEPRPGASTGLVLHRFAAAALYAALACVCGHERGWNSLLALDTFDSAFADEIMCRLFAETTHSHSFVRECMAEFAYAGCFSGPADMRLVRGQVARVMGGAAGGSLFGLVRLPDLGVMSAPEIRGFISQLPLRSASVTGLPMELEVEGQEARACLYSASLLGMAVVPVPPAEDPALRSRVAELLRQLPAPVASPSRSGSKGLDTLLRSEAARMNGLLGLVRSSLGLLLLAIDGRARWDDQALAVLRAVRDDAVPDQWTRLAWEGPPPALDRWLTRLLAAHAQLGPWAVTGAAPPAVWLAGLFYPRLLLSAVLRVCAASAGSPVASTRLRLEVTALAEAPSLAPSSGLLLRGLLLYGARWSPEGDPSLPPYARCGVPCDGCLEELPPSHLQRSGGALPLVLLAAAEEEREEGALELDCPLYLSAAERQSPVAFVRMRTRDAVRARDANPFVAIDSL